MFQFISDKKIKLCIIEKTNKLNKSITEWYNTNYPEDLIEFTGCCDKDEINLLTKCYNIFSKNKNVQNINDDIIRALLMYYYIVIVFEDYVHRYIDEKYVKIVYEDKYSDSQKPNMYLFTDNNGNTYTYHWSRFNIKPYIEIKDQATNEEYYARNKGRETDTYIYRDKKLNIKIKSEQHMNCLDNMLTTEKSKEYYNLLYRGDGDWISQIRKLILNMNTEHFE